MSKKKTWKDPPALGEKWRAAMNGGEAKKFTDFSLYIFIITSTK